MIRQIWHYDWHRVRLPYLLLLLGAVAYLLLREAPLGGFDPVLFLLALAQGVTLAVFQFKGRRAEEAFLFSLPCSRTRLFLSRWGFGLLLQALALALLFGLLVSGVRVAVQQMTGNPLPFALFKHLEYGCLRGYALGTLFAYQAAATVFLATRTRAELRGRHGNCGAFAGPVLAAGLVLFFLLFKSFAYAGEPVGAAHWLGSHWQLLLGSWALASVLLGFLAAKHSYNHLEIEA